MAMTMNGEVQLAAPREAVWAKLNDPDVLKACIPGCEELEKTEDNGFRATAKMKVGPVSARFKGKVMLSDLDPPNGYKITGEGEGGVAGFAKGGATVGLSEKDGDKLVYEVSLKHKGANYDIIVTPEGKLNVVEKAIQESRAEQRARFGARPHLHVAARLLGFAGRHLGAQLTVRGFREPAAGKASRARSCRARRRAPSQRVRRRPR